MSDTENTEILAHIGRKQIELENSRTAFSALNTEYDNLLTLLNNVISGTITPERVTVDLMARSWAVTPASTPETKPEGKSLQ